jgi:hypothetical protein
VICQLDRIEAKAVEKFTTQYEKLCKTCPSRLQPRVETIIQLIAGLPSAEREHLFSRIDSEGIRSTSAAGIPEEKQSFGADVDLPLTPGFAVVAQTGLPEMPQEVGKMKMKKDESMELKCKIAKNERKLAMTVQLLSIFDTCAEPNFDPSPAMAALAAAVGPEYSAEAQAEFMEDLAELQKMPPAARLKRKFKLLEKKAKYERKVFEYQLELDQCAEPKAACMAA